MHVEQMASRHHPSCPAYRDEDGTCACGYHGPLHFGRKFVSHTWAVELWGRFGIARMLIRGQLESASPRQGYYLSDDVEIK